MKNEGFESALGAVIKRRRLEQNLSQEELAARCKLHRTYISSVERGQRNVSLVNIVVIAQALDAKASELFQDADL